MAYDTGAPVRDPTEPAMSVTSPYTQQLAWIDTQYDRMCDLVQRWASINSGTDHLAGLERLTTQLTDAWAGLDGTIELVDLAPYSYIDPAGHHCQRPLAKAIQITKRKTVPRRVFLGIHMDTVYGRDHPFQQVRLKDSQTMVGPGVADAKGGLAVMLVALEALERSGLAEQLGWEVLINSDEEIGSPGSTSVLTQCAQRNDLGLVFEPALADGSLAAARGGSGNFTAVIRGQAAHAGRQFHLGRNAIDAMARLITGLSQLNGRVPGAVVNVGQVEGGGPVNIVPDLAICRFNIRVNDAEAQSRIDPHVDQVIADIRRQEGITVQRYGRWTSPPKSIDPATQTLIHHVTACGQDLGLSINWQSTGGVCDGNKLAAAGLPTVDTLGPRGGDIHSSDEYLLLDSLTERAKLSALLLMKLAAGELAWPGREA